VSEPNVPVVDNAAELAALCERVAREPRVAIDTEFHAERSYSARLMVVQLAFEDGVAIVDPKAVPDLSPLVAALGETTVVGHALSSDLKIFADRYDAVPSRVFDTQVAASFLGYGMQISLADLVYDLRDVRLAKTQTVSDWSARPLSARQIEYLVDDVAHLLPMHDILIERLRDKGRYEWALEECAELGDVARYRVDERRAYMKIPGAIRMNRRELGILNELVKLRDRLARERDLPPKYILADDVVGGLATLRPKALEDLAQLRRLEAGLRRQLGPALLEAVPEADLPERSRRPLGISRDTFAALMSVVVGEIARENGMPAGLLAPRSALERVARELPQTHEELQAALGLSAWRWELLGTQLERLLSGGATLAIEGYADGDPKIRLSHGSTNE
jgi:ribonuclease D